MCCKVRKRKKKKKKGQLFGMMDMKGIPKPLTIVNKDLKLVMALLSL